MPIPPPAPRLPKPSARLSGEPFTKPCHGHEQAPNSSATHTVGGHGNAPAPQTTDRELLVIFKRRVGRKVHLPDHKITQCLHRLRNARCVALATQGLEPAWSRTWSSYRSAAARCAAPRSHAPGAAGAAPRPATPPRTPPPALPALPAAALRAPASGSDAGTISGWPAAPARLWSPCYTCVLCVWPPLHAARFSNPASLADDADRLPGPAGCSALCADARP